MFHFIFIFMKPYIFHVLTFSQSNQIMYLQILQVDGTNWVWVVVFIPGQNGDYPSVCLPQNSPQTTTTTTTKKPFHDHLHDVHWALPGLFPPVDPFLQSFHSSLLYEPLLGWFRSDGSGKMRQAIFLFSKIRLMHDVSI